MMVVSTVIISTHKRRLGDITTQCTWFHPRIARILCICTQEGSSCPPLFSPTTTRFDADIYVNCGSAVLAHFYQDLCRANIDYATEITSCMTLLQVLIIFFKTEKYKSQSLVF